MRFYFKEMQKQYLFYDWITWLIFDGFKFFDWLEMIDLDWSLTN